MTNTSADHVAFIMDGNRRFAKRLMKQPWKGHEWGAEKLKNVLRWCKDAGVTTVTLYAFSLQNLNRPENEFQFLMKTAREFADELLNSEKFQKNEHDVQIRFIGANDVFPDDIRERMRKLEEQTEDNDEYTVNVAAGYGGREEIVTAARRIAEQVDTNSLQPESIDKETFTQHLYLQDEPDMIIRTGGERRTSNFLPWQSVYTEWIFVDKMWPEFEETDLHDCFEEYAQRERRFGE